MLTCDHYPRFVALREPADQVRGGSTGFILTFHGLGETLLAMKKLMAYKYRLRPTAEQEPPAATALSPVRNRKSHAHAWVDAEFLVTTS